MNNILQFAAESLEEGGYVLRFELQPIMRFSTMSVERYEVLYRGRNLFTWQALDEAVIRFLGLPRPELPPLFVNLSNEALLALDETIFIAASSKNDIVFELSEAPSGYANRKSIATKANALISGGVRLALDDFGAGRDGLDRYFSLTGLSYVKIDADFIITCMKQSNAAAILRCLLGQWRAEGVVSVAEGIENEAMFDFASQMGIEMAQGWYVDALAVSLCLQAAEV